ncbi:hypothetical protein K7432_005328 [Basidiobolus ranarum]|uniref:SGNH hydrolase-type esterase domain-containing protein n=1 Tax=Basidiobolus ranarum TaxID=34480 RepID=A0ABR2WWP5_9FUNG
MSSAWLHQCGSLGWRTIHLLVIFMLLCNCTVMAQNSLSSGFVQQDSTNPINQHQINILLLGDSLTAGWTMSGRAIHSYGIQLQKQLIGRGYDAQVEIRGIPGEAVLDSMTQTTRVILDNAECLDRHFDYAIVLAGTNDVFHGYPPHKIMGGLKTIYERIWKHGAKIMALTMPEYDWDRVNHNEPHRIEVNALLRNFTSEQKSLDLQLYDFAHAFPLRSLDAVTRKKLWDSDRIHPSVYGYDVMGDMIYVAFQRLLRS